MSDARTLNRNATAGYQLLMGEIRNGDFDDAWGTTMGWLFGVAEVMFLRFDDVLPGFRPAPSLSIASIEDDYPAGMVLDYVDNDSVTEDDLRDVFTVMSRYADWLKLADRSY